MKVFKNALVYTEDAGLKECSVSFDEHITAIGRADASAEEIPLPSGALVLPGFIDEHIHGAGGCDAMDGTRESLAKISRTLAEEGTTGFLATTMTQSREAVLCALHAVRDYRKEEPDGGARCLGVHLEGPFIAAEYNGAQPLEYVLAPDFRLFEEFYRASGESIQIVTVAPEKDGAEEFISRLCAKGIIVSIGHTGAGYADVLRAYQAGARNVTHTFNAQSAFRHREIGTAGGALLTDGLNCELIADGVHVSVPAMQLLFKCKPKGKVTLITDAMRAKGLGDGVSELGGQTVIVKNGEARLENGALAGSVLRMNRAVQNLVEKVGVPFAEAVDCAAATPAGTLKIDGETGGIRVGKRADFAVVNSNFDVICTVCGGNIVYRA